MQQDLQKHICFAASRFNYRGGIDGEPTTGFFFFLLIPFFPLPPLISLNSLHRPFPPHYLPLYPNRWPPSNGALTPDVQSQCRLGDQLGSVCQWFR